MSTTSNGRNGEHKNGWSPSRAGWQKLGRDLDHSTFLHKVPPNDPAAEMAFLGCVILDAGKCIPLAVSQCGGDPDFYSEKHAMVWRACRAVFAASNELDLVMLLARMGEGVTQIGGSAYLVTLAESVPSPTNWTHYLEIITTAARKRILLDACASSIFRIQQGDSIEDCLTTAADGVAKAADAAGGPKDIRLYDAASQVLKDLEAKVRITVPIGLQAFDDEFGGIPSPGVTTFMGVPRSGKSSLVAGIVVAMARQGMGGRVISYEMSAHSVAANMLGASAEVSVNNALRTGRDLSPAEQYRLGQSLDQFQDLNIEFVEESLSARRIEERCAIYAAKGVKVIVVDYIQNLPAGEPGQRDTERIEEACRVMQRLYRRFGMTVLVVSQMTGAAAKEDRPPKSSDGIGSSAIEQISDCIVGVYRPSVFNPKRSDETEDEWTERSKHAELHVSKYKKGQCAAVQVRFEGQYTRFLDKPYEPIYMPDPTMPWAKEKR